jgi:copper chaperone CopZ
MTQMASQRRVAVIVLRVPLMASRRDVRAVTAALRDLPGVETIQANSSTASLVVEGTVLEQDVRLMLTELGFSADAQPARS